MSYQELSASTDQTPQSFDHRKTLSPRIYLCNSYLIASVAFPVIVNNLAGVGNREGHLAEIVVRLAPGRR